MHWEWLSLLSLLKSLPFYFVRISKISVKHGKLISAWILSSLTWRSFWSMFCLDFFFGKKTRRDSRCSIIQPTLCRDTFRRGQRHIQRSVKHIRWKPLTIFAKCSIVDVWQGCEYVFKKGLYFLECWKEPCQRNLTKSENAFWNNHAKKYAVVCFWDFSLKLKIYRKDWFSWNSFKDWSLFQWPFPLHFL